MKILKIAGSCLNQTPLAWSKNLKNILDCIDLAKSQNVDILCLPELCISGYGCEDTFYSNNVLSQSLEGLKTILPSTEGILVTVGLPMVYENCLYNVVAVLCNQKILGFVAKQELAGDGIHYEPRWFKAWKEHLVVSYTFENQEYPFGDIIFEVDGVRIGFEICEDAWNGNRPAQRHFLKNVDLILNPSASHFAFGKSQTRDLIVKEASRSFACTYVYSNLLGNEAGRVIYDGEIIIAQNGVLYNKNKRFSYQNFQILSSILDLHAPRIGKKKSFNFQFEIPENLVVSEYQFKEKSRLDTPLKNWEYESKEEEFFRAVTLGLFDYMRKSYSNGYMLSLSGGADSCACAVLVAKMLNVVEKEIGLEGLKSKLSYLKIDDSKPLVKQLLTCVYQATENSGEKTLESARELANELGAEFHLWNIQENLNEYHKMIENTISRKLSWELDDITLQNIQARVRAPGIWMLANIKNALLITTSNRSEAAVGYCTMDGDTAGGLAPIGGIDKAFLKKWLIWAQKELNIDALKFVNQLQPSAELRPQSEEQTDEKDLMPYPILDQIEKCFIRDYQSPLEVFRTLRGILPDSTLKSYIKKFYQLWSKNQWKRERYAPCFHLDDENLDPRTWCRFPILSGGFVEELRILEEYED
jgi:NAD+ synthase (glutamine-hydrolysing)